MSKATLTILIYFVCFNFCRPIFGQNIDSLKNNLHMGRYTIYEYNPKGQLIHQKEFNNKNRQTSYQTFSYDSLNRVKLESEYHCCWTLFAKYENIYNQDSTLAKVNSYLGNKISSYTIYSYENKKPVLNRSFNALKKLQTSSTTNYNDVGKATSFIFQSNDKILFHYEFEHTQNGSVLTKFDSNSRKTGTSESIYDSNKNLIKKIERDSSNNTTEILIWVYKDNKKQLTMFLNGKSDTKTLCIDKYDSLGRLTRTEWYEKE